MDNESNLSKPELLKPAASSQEVNISGEYVGNTPRVEVQPMPGEKMAQANNAVSQAVAIPLVPVSSQPVGAAQVTDDGQSDGVVGDDGDVIEKEWVDKAKAIVARTHGDPYAKSNELTGLKKDYMQKRFGKAIKMPSDDSLPLKA